MKFHETTITIGILGHDVETRVQLMYDYIPASVGLREATTGFQLEPDTQETVNITGSKVFTFYDDSTAINADWIFDLFSDVQIEILEQEILESEYEKK